MKSLAEFELYGVVDDIREHLLSLGHELRKWTVASLTWDPRRAVTIAASCDLGEPGGDYLHVFHLSFAGWLGDQRADLPAEDLNGLVPLILDTLAPYATIDHRGDSLVPGTPATHVMVYFGPGPRPLMPIGPQAVTPWSAPPAPRARRQGRALRRARGTHGCR